MRRFGPFLALTLALALAACAPPGQFEREILGKTPEEPPADASRPGQAVPTLTDRDFNHQPTASSASPAGDGQPASRPVPAAPPVPEPAPAAEPAPDQLAPAARRRTPAPEYAPPVAAPTPAPAVTASVGLYQAGVFSHRDNADSLRAVLAASGYAVTVRQVTVQGKPAYRVEVTAQGSPAEIEAGLKALGVTSFRPLQRGEAAPSPDHQPAPVQPPATDHQPAPGRHPAQASAQQAAPVPAAAPRQAPAAGKAAPATAGACEVTTDKIAAIGVGRSEGGDVMAGQRAAIAEAKKQLAVCVKARRDMERPGTASGGVVLPESLVTVSSPIYRADGAIEVRASISRDDLGKVPGLAAP